MFTKLLSAFGIQKKESRAYSALIQLGLDLPIWTPRDYEHLTHVGYQLNADVYACVNLIARSARQIPWLVYKHEGATEVSPKHPLQKLLANPNERDTGSDLIESAIAYLLLSGNAYLERSGGTEKTPPAFIYSHRPDRMSIIKGNRRLIVAGYEYKVAAQPVRFEEWEILHLRLFNPLDDWYGMCYDSATEILTKDRGWQPFDALTDVDQVATRNPQSKAFEWQTPSVIVHEPYSGEMHHFTSRSVDLYVTPKHRMLIQHDDQPEQIISAAELATKSLRHGHFTVPMTSEWEGAEVPEITFPHVKHNGDWSFTISGDDYCALMGAYLAEGNLRALGGIEINQTPNSKAYPLYEALVRRINGGKSGYNGKAFVIGRTSLTAHFSSFGKSNTKFIPDVIRGATKRQLAIFLEYYLAGDGSTQACINNTGRGDHPRLRAECTTVSKVLADHIVEIVQKLGWSASAYTRKGGQGGFLSLGEATTLRQDSHRLRIRYSKTAAVTECRTARYDGTIHCVSVPNGIVYVRRNGKPAWCGNSPIEAAAYTIDCSNESAKLYKRLLQKGYPPGAVTIKAADYTDVQIQQLKVGLKRTAENGEVLVLQDATWQEMGFKPVDASLFEGKLFNKRDIAACYGVPSGMIGDTQVKTYANSREERRSLYTEAVIPAIDKLKDGLNNWLGPVFDGAYIDIDKDAIDALAEDRETQAKRVVVLFEKGLIKRNEGRAELKYDQVPEDEDGYFSEVAQPLRGLALPDGGQGGSTAPNSRNNLLEDPNRNDQAKPPAGQQRVVPINSRREDPGWGRHLKNFNLLSEQERDSYWKSLDARRDDWDSRIKSDVGERFSEEQHAVIKAFRDGGESAALKVVARQEQQWAALYQRIVFSVGEEFGRRTVLSIKFDGYTEMETKFELDLFTTTLLKWLSTEGAKRVVGVLDTTKEKIRIELQAGVTAGESTYVLAKRLEAMYTDFSYVRAERIARTEVQGASSLGSQTAARATNLPLVKEWLSTRDDRVRDTHMVGNGQKQLLNTPYIIGGSRMMYPGDSTLGAPASEIIQCRCSETYSVQR